MMTPGWMAGFVGHCEALVGRPMKPETRRFTQEVFRPVSVKKSEFFLRAGEVPEHLAFTATGLLRCFLIDPEGREATKFFCTEGESCSSYGALVRRRESGLFIQALEDSVVLRARWQDVALVVDEDPFLSLLLRRSLERILFLKEDREDELLRFTAQERYTHFLRQYPQLAARVNDEHIASYLGVTPQSLSRIRKSLRDLPLGKDNG